jgi:hypothetical protein
MSLIRRSRNTACSDAAKIVCIVCCVGLALSATASAEELPETHETDRSKVVAHWKIQKGIAGSTASSSQLIEDSSGNNRHGHAVGGPRFQAVELPTTNLALVFDGRDDRIAIADAPGFHLTKSFTIEAWIEIAYYAGSRQNHAFIVFRGDKREGFDPWYLCIEESGQLKFMITDLLNETSTVMSPAPLPTRNFIHVAAVLDDETGTQSLFVDGKRVASTKTKIRAGGLLGGTGAGIGIGGRQDHSHQGYRGSIAEVRITAAALTKSEFLKRRR